MQQRIKIYNPNRSLDPYQPSPLGLPVSMPGFGSLGVGSTPATHSSALNGFDYDWSSLGTSLIKLLPQAVSTASQAITASYAVKQAQADAARIRAEAESTSALATLEKMKNSPMTWGVIAAVVVAGGVGYLLFNKKSRERRTVRRRLRTA